MQQNEQTRVTVSADLSQLRKELESVEGLLDRINKKQAGAAGSGGVGGSAPLPGVSGTGTGAIPTPPASPSYPTPPVDFKQQQKEKTEALEAAKKARKEAEAEFKRRQGAVGWYEKKRKSGTWDLGDALGSDYNQQRISELQQELSDKQEAEKKAREELKDVKEKEKAHRKQQRQSATSPPTTEPPAAPAISPQDQARIAKLDLSNALARAAEQRREAQETLKGIQARKREHQQDYRESEKAIDRSDAEPDEKNHQKRMLGERAYATTKGIAREEAAAKEDVNNKLQEEKELKEALRSLRRAVTLQTIEEKTRTAEEKAQHAEWKAMTTSQLESELKRIKKTGEGSETYENPDGLEGKNAKAAEGITQELNERKKAEREKREGRWFQIRRGANGEPLTDMGFQTATRSLNSAGAQMGTTIGEIAHLGTNIARAGVLAGIPTGIAGALELVLKQARAYETSQTHVNQIVRPASISEGSMLEFGINSAQYRTRLGDVVRERGTGQGVDEQTRRQMLLERGFGIDKNTFSQANNMVINSSGNKDTAGQMQQIMGILENADILQMNSSTFDVSPLNKFIPRFFEIQQQQLNILGRISPEKANSFLGGIIQSGRADSLLRTPDGAGRAAAGFQSAFSATDDLSYFYNVQAYLKSNPQAVKNPLDISLGIEKAAAGQDLSTVRNRAIQAIERAKTIGGQNSNMQDYFATGELSGLLGLSMTQANDLYKDYQANPDKFLTTPSGQDKSYEGIALSRVSEVTDRFLNIEAKLATSLQGTGEIVANKLNTVIEILMTLAKSDNKPTPPPANSSRRRP